MLPGGQFHSKHYGQIDNVKACSFLTIVEFRPTCSSRISVLQMLFLKYILRLLWRRHNKYIRKRYSKCNGMHFFSQISFISSFRNRFFYSAYMPPGYKPPRS